MKTLDEVVISEDAALITNSTFRITAISIDTTKRRALSCEANLWNVVIRSINVVLLSNKIHLLIIPFGPFAIFVDKLTGHHGWVFFFCLLGIIPLAERLGYATEQLAFYTGSTVGGLMNATFGNATEMIISIHALRHGMIHVVKQTLLGSILSNLLLVLGCAFLSGGLVHSNKTQVFSKEFAGVNSGLLLMAVMGLLMPAVLHTTGTEMRVGESELALSRFSSCVMLFAYAAFLYYQMKSQNNQCNDLVHEGKGRVLRSDDEIELPEICMWESMIWLVILTVCVAVISEHLVKAIQGASVSMNMPVSFLSVVLLPIVGNAAEHAGAIMFAIKDNLDLSLGVAIGSSTQMAMFGIPFCVMIGWAMGCPMDLNFELFETASLLMAVLVVTFMLQEGSSNYIKGLMLILCYLIVAASFFVHYDDPNTMASALPPHQEHSKALDLA